MKRLVEEDPMWDALSILRLDTGTAKDAGERVDNWLDTAHPGWVRVIGAGLVAFALAVIALSRSNAPNRRRSSAGPSTRDPARNIPTRVRLRNHYRDDSRPTAR